MIPQVVCKIYTFEKNNCMIPKRYFSLLLLAISYLLLSACKFRQKVNLIVHHAIIYTVDEKFSTAEAMAIRDGKIIAVGTNDNILKQYEADEEVNASGKFIYPGFIDAHAHFVGYGQSLQTVNLVGTDSWQEVIQRCNDFANGLQENVWLTGRGWDQNDWAEKDFPSNEKLNELFPGRPVLLRRIDGHAAIANQKALELAGIKPGDKLTGGEIVVKDNKLTGLLVDNAVALVSAKIPAAN